MRLYTLLLAMVLGISITAQAQKGEEVKVPLSNPGQAGTLIANSHRGSMTIEAYGGNEVLVFLQGKEDKDNWGKKGAKSGLKKIAGGSANAEITEENNVVKVSVGSQNEMDLVIKVPKNFSVNLKTHHNGDIYVKGINGTSEINAHHGDVALEDVGSSANVNTHHGEITATFRGVDSSKPMVLTTYHGDVDISLPAGTTFTTKLKTTKGDIYTDFELDMKAVKNKVDTKNGSTKIEIGGWRHGAVGSGGQEYMLSTYHGDLIIRKND